MNNTKQLKKFIKEFNFPEPSWDNLPGGFPNCDTKGLTPHEEGLFSAIQLIWYANFDGRPKLLKKFTQSMSLILLIIISGLIIKNILTSNMFTRVVSVNAATVSGTLRSGSATAPANGTLSPSDILQSSMSAILK